MNKTLIIFLAVAVFFQFIAYSQEKVIEELDAYVARTSNYMGDAPYAIVVSKNGKIIHEKYGDGGRKLGEISAESRWQLFSITKSFISALLLKLVDEKVISLDDPVSDYLSAFKSKGTGAYDRRNVTIRHLASHTSGTAVKGVRLPANLPKDINAVEIVTEPGKDFLYSGLGMYLLEHTLQSATGKDLDQLLREKVLNPLQLTSAAYVYGKNDAHGPVMPLRPNSYSFSKKGHRASSGLFITARDLNKFGQFWLDTKSLFPDALKKEVWKQHGTRDSDGGSYGLLWWLFTDHGGYVMSGHQYKINAVIPEKGVVVTVIRYPQNDAVFEFWPDKHAIVTFGNRF